LVGHSRYRIKSPPVVAETLDGEATIVDLESGTYYALNESGTFIWDELGAGRPVDSVAEGLSAHYEIDAEASRRAVDDLAAKLLERELIAPLEGEGDAGSSASNGSSHRRRNGGYVEPELSTFTDMQELLLLDPVHEVDEAGWPHLPDQPPSQH
jgi:hypothetical protein